MAESEKMTKKETKRGQQEEKREAMRWNDVKKWGVKRWENEKKWVKLVEVKRGWVADKVWMKDERTRENKSGKKDKEEEKWAKIGRNKHKMQWNRQESNLWEREEKAKKITVTGGGAEQE